MLNKKRKMKNKNFHRNKKGIEPVIATVLLIVVTIAVAGLVVVFIFGFINPRLDQQRACGDVRLDIDLSGTCTNGTVTCVMVSYASGNINLSKIKIQATSAGRTDTKQFTTDLPDIGGARTYGIKVNNSLKVGAIPYAMYGNNEFSCDIGKAELTQVPKMENCECAL
jgi:flagellin-like protein